MKGKYLLLGVLVCCCWRHGQHGQDTVALTLVNALLQATFAGAQRDKCCLQCACELPGCAVVLQQHTPKHADADTDTACQVDGLHPKQARLIKGGQTLDQPAKSLTKTSHTS